jgi:hypothetical protein
MCITEDCGWRKNVYIECRYYLITKMSKSLDREAKAKRNRL